jgi:hypothetical protein
MEDWSIKSWEWNNGDCLYVTGDWDKRFECTTTGVWKACTLLLSAVMQHSRRIEATLTMIDTILLSCDEYFAVCDGKENKLLSIVLSYQFMTSIR